MNTIYFNRETNLKKRSTIRDRNLSCPFCDISQLDTIIDTRDDMMLVKNKYSTLKDANMMVLIESSVCEANTHTYSFEKLKTLLQYGIEKWMEYEALNEYKSVAFFKNKGLHSSGTISHPHMQIIGFKHQDIYNDISIDNLVGYEVAFEQIKFNMSTLPKISFIEYNIEIGEDFDSVVKTVSLLSKYIEATYYGTDASYNFFFYNMSGKRYLKIIPRYPTSAIYIGYNIVQIYDENQFKKYENEIHEFWLSQVK